MPNEVVGKLTNKRLEDYNDLFSEANNVREFALCANDVNYFLKTYYKITTLDEGITNFTPYPWQEECTPLMVENRFTILMLSRRSGKSSLVAGVLLWFMVFNKDYNIAVIANKFKRAKEIIKMIDICYTDLPNFLKMPFTTRSQSALSLINGSRIEGFATSADALRGGGFNIVFCDEMAFIPPHVQKQFMESTYPVISSGTQSKVIITSTPNGIGDEFHRIWNDAVTGKNRYVYRKYDYKCVPEHDNDDWVQETISNLGSIEKWRQEYLCEFLSSQFSIFNTQLMENLERTISTVRPIYEVKEIGLRVFTEEFKARLQKSNSESLYNSVDNEFEDKFYARQYRIITVDIGEGLGGDFSVATFLRFDPSNKKIVEEATIRNNLMSVEKFAGFVYSVAESFNFPFLIFENNNKGGGEFTRCIAYEYEYPNLYYNQGKKEYGVLTRNNTKNIGIKTFKTLVENDIFKINNYDTYIEMNYFEQSKPGIFSAKPGYTDDSMMSLLIFCYVYQTNKELIANMYGTECMIDHMYMTKEAEQKTILEELEAKMKMKKMEKFDEWDVKREMAMERNINLAELEEAGVNTSIFKSNGDTNKNIWY